MWYKSTIIRGFAAAVLVAWAATLIQAQAEETDPVLEYYWSKAGETAIRTDPNQPGVAYRLTAKSYRLSVGEAGQITRTDSVLQDFYYRDGRLDSVTTLRGKAGRFGDLDFFWPSVFEMDYSLSLFPNDTGGPSLPIELMADSAALDEPDGLVLIDRYQYYLKSLYLYYPAKEGYRRYTRAYRFRETDGYVFPDSVWVVATKLGVFFTESFRLESGITDVEILSKPAP